MEVLPWPQRGWQGEREQLWVKLEHYLKLHLTANVLMPAPLGEKRPAYTHAAGTWTWARYDWVCRDQKAIAKHDLGLLVRDVIVVDIDTVKDADALESRFPELCTAPAETTARGRHYFFQRSAKADSDGYYDGPAQRIPAVDLKTRAWGGGSGFVIVAPSTNKTWLRSPWDACPNGMLPIISDALLDAIATARHAPLRVSLRFMASPASAAVERESTLLSACTYVTTALAVGDEQEAVTSALGAISLSEGASASTAAPPAVLIPEQFSADLIADLERVAAGRDLDIGDLKAPPAWLANAAAYESRMEAIIALADFLGVPAAPMATIRSASAGGTRNRGLWMNINHAWALDCMAATADAEAGKLVTVDAALSATLTHQPLLPSAPHDHRWILHEGPRSRERVPPGTRVLADDPSAAAAAALPAFVLKALRSEAGHLALAGGAALAAVTRQELATSDAVADYDLFVYGFEGSSDTVSANADALLRRIAALPGIVRGQRGAMVSRHAVTFRVRAANVQEMLVQIILRVAKSPADILSGFDLAPSKVCVLYNSSDASALTVLAAPDWPLAMQRGAYALDGRCWSRATSLRVFKYIAKGYDALVPALTNRNKLLYSLKGSKKWWAGRQKLGHLDGFELLYALERHLSIDDRPWYASSDVKKNQRRIRAKDVERVARRLRMDQRTDYATAAKTLRTLLYVVSYAYWGLAQRLGIVSVPDALRQPLGWRQPWSQSQFHPAVADALDALNLVDTPGN